jgi:hypothetical protein
MREALPPLSQYVLMASCSVKHRDTFTFFNFLVVFTPPLLTERFRAMGAAWLLLSQPNVTEHYRNPAQRDLTQSNALYV